MKTQVLNFIWLWGGLFKFFFIKQNDNYVIEKNVSFSFSVLNVQNIIPIEILIRNLKSILFKLLIKKNQLLYIHYIIHQVE